MSPGEESVCAADAVAAAKAALRVRMRKTLAAMNADQRAMKSAHVCDRIVALADFAAARSIMLYLPMPGEADCTQLIEKSLAEGRTVCVPHVDWNSRGMIAAHVSSLDAEKFVIDRHHVRVPREIEPVAIESIECVIVPGLAFDEHCRRLGRGGGFYDRFLARLPESIPTIGLAFECQIVVQLPCAAHDAGARMVATESRLLQCR